MVSSQAFKERYQLSLLGALLLQGAYSVEYWSFAHQLLNKGSSDHRTVKSQDSRIIEVGRGLWRSSDLVSWESGMGGMASPL